MISNARLHPIRQTSLLVHGQQFAKKLVRAANERPCMRVNESDM